MRRLYLACELMSSNFCIQCRVPGLPNPRNSSHISTWFFIKNIFTPAHGSTSLSLAGDVQKKKRSTNGGVPIKKGPREYKQASNVKAVASIR